MKALLRLQELDLKIEAFKARETEIPKQKGKFEVRKKRLAAELEERKDILKQLQMEQHACETDIEQMQAQIGKYETQLLSVKKNEEYQALLHEIDGLKKQIGLKEERIIALMLELDEARARLTEDQDRIDDELKKIEAECGQIDGELDEAVQARKALEQDRVPVCDAVEASLLSKYDRIRRRAAIGAAAVPVRGETCTGCNMSVPPQIVNEVLAGKVRSCNHCGRLLYDRDHVESQDAGASVG